jgi:hypothetical protein
MATENLYATSLTSGSVSTSANALGSTSGTWTTDADNTSWTARFAMGNPTAGTGGNGTHTVTVRVRKETGTGNPTVDSVTLYEGSTSKGVISSGSTSVTSTTGQDIVCTFNTATIGVTDWSNVEIQIATTQSGGGPSARSAVQLDYIHWSGDFIVLPKSGSASGGYAFAGSSTGAYPVYSNWSASDTESTTGGSTPNDGAATGGFAFSGSATGATTKGGSASGSFTLAGSSTGSRASRGSASGGFAFAGSATGDAPANSGSASGTYSFAGSAAGERDPEGSSTGGYALSGSATGSRASSGTASGGYAHAGSAAGSRASEGAATGGFAFDGSAVGDTTPAVRTNLVLNPSFEVDTTDWQAFNSAASISRNASLGDSGSASLSIVTVTAFQPSMAHQVAFMPATDGVTYATSCRIYAAATSRTCSIVIDWYTSGDVLITSTTVESKASTVGAWVTYSGTAVAPATTAKAKVRLTFNSNAVGQTHHYDSVLFEEASSVGTYFDGSTSDSGSWDYEWTGTAHNSTSTATEANLPNVGAGTGGYSFSGSATGERDSLGSSSGGYAFAGTAAGEAPPNSGSASGSFDFSGTAVGETPANAGAASGSFTFSGSAAGSRPSAGAATGSYDFTGSTSGDVPPNDGTAQGSFTFTGSATGSAPRGGSATGGYAYAGSAVGFKGEGGFGLGGFAFIGTAQGERDSAGAATGSYAFGGTATGEATPIPAKSGSASSTLGWFGFAYGTAPEVPDNEGAAEGGYALSGSAQGRAQRSGSTIGWFTFTGTASGEADDPEFTFSPPTYQRVLNPPVLTGHKRRPIPVTETMSVVRIGGTLTLVKSPTHEQLEAAGVEGEDYFIGGHVYNHLPQSVSTELEAAGFTTTPME